MFKISWILYLNSGFKQSLISRWMHQSHCIPRWITISMYYLDLGILINSTIPHLKDVRLPILLRLKSWGINTFLFKRIQSLLCDIKTNWLQMMLTLEATGWLNKTPSSSVEHLHRRCQWGPRGPQTIQGLLSQSSRLIWFEWGRPQRLGDLNTWFQVWCCWGAWWHSFTGGLTTLMWALRFLLFLTRLPLADMPPCHDRLFFSC